MNSSQTQIDALVRLLESAESRPPTAEERAMLRAALVELIGAQSVIAVQEALLRSFDADAGRIDELASGALERARSLVAAPAPAEGYDFASAAAARRVLIERVKKAESGGAILDAALRFVSAALVLAG